MKRLYVIGAVLCISVLSSGQVFGPPPSSTTTGIPDVFFDFAAASQKQSSWCWAASIQMILKYHGLDVDQSEVVTRAYGAPVNLGATDFQISNSLNTWAITKNGKLYRITSVTAKGPPPQIVLIHELDQLHPVLLTFSTGPFSGHAVVITEATYHPRPNLPPQIDSLTLRDPWPSPENIENRGIVEIREPSLETFISQVRSNWLVSVQAIPQR